AGAARRVVGVYADYGNPAGEVVVPAAWLQVRAPGAPFAGAGARMDPADAPAFIAAMSAELGVPEDQIIDQIALKRYAAEVFESTFAVTAALSLLTLGAAGVALFASLLTLADRRLAQLAPVWCMGLTRRRLAALELGKLLALAALTAVIAIPLGILVTWLLVSVVNVQSFGWRLPLHLYPLQLLETTALALGVAALAAAAPIRRLSRIAPAALAKAFADAR
ncbi:MAG: FtsX-like permease family protein, partial [Pseudomonadota bacterium]